MAKRRTQINTDLFARTEQAAPKKGAGGDVEIPADGRTTPVSVGLRESEVAMLEAIAGDLGVARNAVMRYALRWFLYEYHSGNVDLASDVETPQTRNRLNMP